MGKQAIEVERLGTGPEADAEWDRMLSRSPAASVFHRAAWLTAAAEESGTELVRLVARSGSEARALLPLFLQRRGGLRLVFSPPPGCAVPELGPVLLRQHHLAHQADRENDAREAVDALHAHVTAGLRPHLTQLLGTRSLADVRPFLWNGYAASPLYTYLLDLGEGAERVFQGFKPRLRSYANGAGREGGVTVAEGTPSHFQELVAAVRTRYREQGMEWTPSPRYVERLYRDFGGREIRVKVALREGEVVGGLVLLVESGTVRHWIGGLRTPGGINGVNELLHWSVVQEYAALGFSTYELLGANTQHLCAHKSRFDPAPAVYFRLEHGSAAGRALAAALRGRTVRRLARALRRPRGGR